MESTPRDIAQGSIAAPALERVLLTQPESQAWIRQWHKWKPMVSVDYHEMGSNSPYYFHPGEELRRNPLIPDRARELTSAIARRHAAWLDSDAVRKHLAEKDVWQKK